MFGQILLNVVFQLVYFVGAVFLIGWLMSKLNKTFYRMTGGGMAVCLATGALGTPIHELSHAAMCVVFRHKIHDIKLFQIGDEDGVLGYVTHSYNPKNIWAVIGNYFIGVAPIIGGSGVIFLLISWLLPNAYTEISSLLSGFADMQAGGFSEGWLEGIGAVCLGMIAALFSNVSVGFSFWFFYIVAMCIALHVTLSGADIKGALPALPMLAGALLVINLVLGLLLPDVYVGFLSGMNSFGGYLIGLMCLSLVLSLSCILLLLLIRLIIGIVRSILHI
jgi:hypothetical protein